MQRLNTQLLILAYETAIENITPLAYPGSGLENAAIYYSQELEKIKTEKAPQKIPASEISQA